MAALIRTQQRNSRELSSWGFAWHEDDYELDFSGEDAERRVSQVEQFNTDLVESGSFVFACGLQPASSSTVMRPDAGYVVTTDGPFAESKEQIGGFWIVEAPDTRTAMELARRAAVACEGPVEMRPTQGE